MAGGLETYLATLNRVTAAASINAVSIETFIVDRET